MGRAYTRGRAGRQWGTTAAAGLAYDRGIRDLEQPAARVGPAPTAARQAPAAAPPASAAMLALQTSAGNAAAVAAAASPGSRSLAREAAPAAPPADGGTAASLIAGAVGSPAALMGLLDGVDEATARTVLTTAAQSAAATVAALLPLAPPAPVVKLIAELVPAQEIAAALDRAGASPAARVLKALAGAGALALAGPIIVALSPETARAILAELDREVIGPLMREVEAVRQMVRDAVDQRWPVGMGVQLEGGLGATFGIPLYVGADYAANVSRRDRDNFALWRRGEARVAADTGVGAGVFVGTGAKGGAPAKGSLGVGAAAGAEAQAGYKMIAIQEFLFPVFTDAGFTALLIALTGHDASTGYQIQKLLLDTASASDPNRFLRSSKMELKTYGEANAGADAGLKRAEGDEKNRTPTTFGPGQGVGGTGKDLPMPLRLLGLVPGASLAGKIALEAGVGAEILTPDGMRPDPATGILTPPRATISFYLEGAALAQVAGQVKVPGFAAAMAAGTPVGAGVKLTMEATDILSGTPKWKPDVYSAYTKTGEMDQWQGSASETSVSFREAKPGEPAIPTDLKGLRDRFQNVTIKLRVGLGTVLGSGFAKAMLRQKTFQTMLKGAYRDVGMRLEGFVHLETSLNQAQVQQLIDAIAGSGAKAAGGQAKLTEDLIAFLSTGRASPALSGYLKGIGNALLAGLSKVHLRAQAGLGIAAGAQASEGAKVRLHGSATGMLTFDADLLNSEGGAGVRQQVTVDDLLKLVESGAAQLDSAVQLTADEVRALIDGVVPDAAPAPAPAPG